jgi:hypothetical protein
MRFKAALQIDLPSEQVFEHQGTLSKIFGAKATPTGDERVVGSTLAVIDRFVRAYQAMGISNVIALKVDQKTIYLDNAMVEDDLRQMVDALEANRGVLSETFDFIHLVVEHDVAGIHYVFDTKVRGQVTMGAEEVYVVISGKIDALNPTPGETAAAYDGRLRKLLSMPGFLASTKLLFERKVKEFRDQLKVQTGASEAVMDHLEVGLVRPSRRSVLELASVPFGQHEITFRHRGIVDDGVTYFHDPYSVYYRNPFDTLTNLVFLSALIDHSTAELPIATVLYNHDGSVLGIASHLHIFQDRLADVPVLASARAVAALDTPRPLSDPYLAQAVTAYGAPVGDVG